MPAYQVKAAMLFSRPMFLLVLVVVFLSVLIGTVGASHGHSLESSGCVKVSLESTKEIDTGPPHNPPPGYANAPACKPPTVPPPDQATPPGSGPSHGPPWLPPVNQLGGFFDSIGLGGPPWLW